MKKFLSQWMLLLTMCVFAFASCSDDDSPEPKPTPTPTPEATVVGAYILHEGEWGQNNSKLSFYNIEGNKLTSNVFEAQNEGLALGETAQDILVYGSKMYITVTASQMIFITDLNGKLIEKISTKENDIKYESPRYLAAYDGFVYADFYSGHVVKLDTTTLNIVKDKEIPKYSEQMTVANDKLYITNSRHDNSLKGNTITVVDLKNFDKENSLIEVRVNPTLITSDEDGNVYVLSMGDYTDANKNALSVIKVGSEKAELLKENAASCMAYADGTLYLAYRDFSNKTVYSTYNTKENKLGEDPFITIPEAEKDELNKAYSISIDPQSADIYVSTSDYTTTGSMYIFDKDGVYKTHFKTGGVGPNKAVFISE